MFSKLKELLDLAIQARINADEDRKSSTLFNLEKDAWDRLVEEIEQSAPLVMITREGERLNVGTVGLLVDRSMLLYSPKLNSQYTFAGHNLNAIVDFDRSYKEIE